MPSPFSHPPLPPLSPEQRRRAFASARKPEIVARQRLPVRYHVEDFPVEDRPRRFLQAFAAILKHTNYRLALDHYARVSAKCARCTAQCQIYLATRDPRDVPCYRSELLLSVYRRHFTLAGILRARWSGGPHGMRAAILTDTTKCIGILAHLGSPLAGGFFDLIPFNVANPAATAP